MRCYKPGIIGKRTHAGIIATLIQCWFWKGRGSAVVSFTIEQLLYRACFECVLLVKNTQLISWNRKSFEAI